MSSALAGVWMICADLIARVKKNDLYPREQLEEESAFLLILDIISHGILLTSDRNEHYRPGVDFLVVESGVERGVYAVAP